MPVYEINIIFYQLIAYMPLPEHKDTCSDIFYVLSKCIEFLFIVNDSLYGHYRELVFLSILIRTF